MRNINLKFIKLVKLNQLKILGTLLLIALLFTNCKDDDEVPIRPNAEEFNLLRESALNNQTQNFQFNVDDGNISFTSTNGVDVGINSNCLSLAGNPVTGMIDVEFVELFDRGTMLATNKRTMGLTSNNDKAILISGGEFYIDAKQNDISLDANCGISLIIPGGLTGGIDPDMTLWTGTIDENDDLTWEEPKDSIADQGVFNEGGNYFANFGSFGWTNCDRFYNDPRPKTSILAEVPEGYDNKNSAVYLSYNGEGSALANLDTYIPATKQFSEHYGLVPIGLECNAIFVTEEDGQWRYAIQAVTVVNNGVIIFTFAETVLGSENDLVDAINALP